MVGFFVFFFSIFSFLFLQAEVMIEATIDQNRGYLHFPLSGTITITTSEGEKIDPDSFTINGATLSTSYYKQVSLTGATKIGIYRFSLPAKQVGSHTLPPISVKVGKQTYHSLATNYFVVDKEPPPEAKLENAFLKLEAFVRGSSKLYLGERTTLVYRLFYNQSIDLTKSHLPFVHLTQFIKIGDAKVTEKEQNGVTVQEIAQMIEAKKTGFYEIGPSFVEGYAYHISLSGEKRYSPQLLYAKAPAVTIEVALFSDDQQPASFNGIIGPIEASLDLLSPAQLKVGESLSILLSIKGAKNINEISLPDLLCQPGFSGLFEFNHLASFTEIKGDVKKFYFQLRVLNELVFELPSLEITSFHSKLHDYQVIRTAALPLTVTAANKKIPKFPKSFTKKITKPFLVSLYQQKVKLANPFIFTHPFKQVAFANHFFPIYLFFSSLLVFLGSWKGKKWLKKRKKNNANKSTFYLKQAKANQEKPQCAVKLIEKALIYKLMEMKIFDLPVVQLERLTSPSLKNFYDFFLQLESVQYSSCKEVKINKFIKEAEILILHLEKRA